MFCEAVHLEIARCTSKIFVLYQHKAKVLHGRFYVLVIIAI